MAKTWYKRRVPPGRFAQRPWWRRVKGSSGMDYVRDDGRRLRDVVNAAADLANADSATPMMTPTPCGGQVWRHPDGEEEIVSGVRPGPPVKVSLAGGPYSNWTAPPADAVLVEGAFAPWAPFDWTPP